MKLSAATALVQIALAVLVLEASACATSGAKTSHVEGGNAQLAAELAELSAEGPLYFETNTDVLDEPSQVLLQRIAAKLHDHQNVTIVVGGHADERADTAYNLALGERRAQAARDYLALLGVDGVRVRLVSFGEEQPASAEHHESAWAQNRRDEFTFLIPGTATAGLTFDAR